MWQTLQSRRGAWLNVEESVEESVEERERAWRREERWLEEGFQAERDPK